MSKSAITKRLLVFLSCLSAILIPACQIAHPSPAVVSSPSSVPGLTPSPTMAPSRRSTPTPSALPVSTPTPPQTPLVPMDAFQQGISYFSWSQGGFSSARSDAMLDEVIRPLGTTWVAIAFECYQDSIHSAEIRCDTPATPSIADLTHVIQYAHNLGLRVMLKPHLWLWNDPGHWRGQIGLGADDAWWGDWFAAYTEFIVGYASLAEEHDVDYFVVGTELPTASRRAEDWRAVVETVRSAYSGPVTYAAASGEEGSITWWDALDAIGVDAYYPLTQAMDPSPDQLREAWVPIVSMLSRLSRTWNLPIILTEIGYRSIDGANRTPWQASGIVVDLEEQADLYRAVIDAFSDHDWWQGVFWWVLSADSGQNDILGNEFTPINKPAEDVLRAFYGAIPRPTATPTPVLVPDSELVIYDDALAAGWDDWSWDAQVNLRSLDIVGQGESAIAVSVRPSGALSLSNPRGVRSSPYRWLQFDIFHTGEPDGYLIVSINEYPALWSFRQSLSNPMYIEGGRFLPGEWQRVRIPLADLGIQDGSSITRISIQEQSGIPQTFLVDEIRLVGAVPVSP